MQIRCFFVRFIFISLSLFTCNAFVSLSNSIASSQLTSKPKHLLLKMSSPTKPTTCIEDLPPEMIRELFKNMDTEDLIACSMVNKRWHSIYAAFKLHRLVVFDYDPDFELVKWWYDSNRLIRETQRCSQTVFNRLAEKPLLSNLKQLAVCGYKFEFDLNKLNRFRHLVHLEIDTPLAGKVHLSLPRLKVLVIHYINGYCALSIDCPQLSTLYYYEYEDVNLLEMKHPETIRRLETNLVGSKLAPFKGVEPPVT